MNKRNAMTVILVLAIVGGVTVFNTFQDPEKNYRERVEDRIAVEGETASAFDGIRENVESETASLLDGIREDINSGIEQGMVHLTDGQAFLKAKEREPNVVKMPSGLMYRVIKAGSGATPGPRSEVLVHYEGRFINDEVFDKSGSVPSRFNVGRIIPGWTEGLQLMQEGAQWELYIPYHLAYGEEGKPPRIPGYCALVFTLELKEVLQAGDSG